MKTEEAKRERNRDREEEQNNGGKKKMAQKHEREKGWKMMEAEKQNRR